MIKEFKFILLFYYIQSLYIYFLYKILYKHAINRRIKHCNLMHLFLVIFTVPNLNFIEYNCFII